MRRGRTLKKRIIFLPAILCLSLLLTACGSGSFSLEGMKETAAANVSRKEGKSVVSDEYKDVIPDFVFTYAENQPEDYPTVQGAEYFARRVNEETKGRIQIRIYANGILGEEPEVADRVSFGSIDFARVSTAQLTKYSPMTRIIIMPYLYRDADHMWKVLEGTVGQQVMDSFDGTGLVPLSWYDAGVRDFYLKEPVDGLDDLKGKTIRVQKSDIMQDMIRAFGATPTTNPYDEVYSAIETGQVDGAENNWPSYVAMKHYQVAGYFLLDDHMRIPELQLVSESTMEQLPEEDRDIIRKCAEESAVYERKVWSGYEEEARKSAIEAGTEVISFSDAEKARFRAAVQPLYEKYCGDYMDLIEEIRKEGE